LRKTALRPARKKGPFWPATWPKKGKVGVPYIIGGKERTVEGKGTGASVKGTEPAEGERLGGGKEKSPKKKVAREEGGGTVGGPGEWKGPRKEPFL